MRSARDGRDARASLKLSETGNPELRTGHPRDARYSTICTGVPTSTLLKNVSAMRPGIRMQP